MMGFSNYTRRSPTKQIILCYLNILICNSGSTAWYEWIEREEYFVVSARIVTNVEISNEAVIKWVELNDNPKNAILMFT